MPKPLIPCLTVLIGLVQAGCSFPEPDRIVVASRLHEPTGESRFWDALLRFEGTAHPEARWTGPWSCFPLDTREDTLGVAPGTWTIEAVD